MRIPSGPDAWPILPWLLLLPAFALDEAARIESRLQGLLLSPGYEEAFYQRVDAAFLYLSRPNAAGEAAASRRVQAALVDYAGRTLHLRFIEDARFPAASMTMKVCGNRIVVNVAWLQHASEDHLHAALAHEVAHDAKDCIRFWLIEKCGLDRSGKADLMNRIEMQADAAAIALLQRRGRCPGSLIGFLKRYLPPCPASQARIAALERLLSRGPGGP